MQHRRFSTSSTISRRPQLFPFFLSTPALKSFQPSICRPRLCAVRCISQSSPTFLRNPNTRRVATTTLLVAAGLLRGAGLSAASRGVGFAAVLTSLSLLLAPRREKAQVAASDGKDLFAGSRSAWAADNDEELEAATAPRALSSPSGLIRVAITFAARVLNECLVPLLNALRLAWFDMQVTVRSTESSNGSDKFFMRPLQSGRRRKNMPWEGVSWQWMPPGTDDKRQTGEQKETGRKGELSQEEIQIMRLGNAAKGAATQAKSAATQATDALRGFFDRLT